MSDIALPANRQMRILEQLESNKSITVNQVVALCGVSAATARRDLDEMALAGMLCRTHGGAVLEQPERMEIFHEEKMKLMIPEKQRIADAALQFVHDNSSLYLDSGTTALFLAKQLKQFRNLTIVTHNLDIAYSVQLHPTSTMILTGGIRRDGYNVLVGTLAEEMVEGLSVDVSFLGADAINEKHGIFNSSFSEIGIKRKILACGRKVVLISDHTKFRKKALTKVCGLDAFDAIITDSGLDPAIRENLENGTCKLILA